ncbi:replicase, partial [Plesiomonas shigelloides]|uniref:primase C-terminal domain-containing protein n=1 Tax=Plesiomonas shigelloides TaxID=703 RepID=UPI0013CC2D0C
RAIRQGWPEYDQWLQACIERAQAYNLQFSAPLDENEVMGIAKSIAKWTHSKFSDDSFNEYVKNTHSKDIQSIRGRRGGHKSKGGGRLKNPLSERQSKPWVKLGIGRTTYYKRKKSE